MLPLQSSFLEIPTIYVITLTLGSGLSFQTASKISSRALSKRDANFNSTKSHHLFYILYCVNSTVDSKMFKALILERNTSCKRQIFRGVTAEEVTISDV